MKQGCFRKCTLAWVLTLVMAFAIMPANSALAYDGYDYGGNNGYNGGVTTPSIIISSTSAADSSTINLTTETIYLDLPYGINVAQFSVDAGRRWRNGRLPTGTGLTALFNAGMTLHVRTVAGGGVDNVLITFPPIAPRPSANHERLRPWFTNDSWELRARPVRANNPGNPPAPAAATYQIVPADALGRLPVNPAWREPAPDDFLIPAVGTRVAMFFRSEPSRTEAAGVVTYTPTGRPFRLRPASLRRPLNLTINYATEIIRTRVDQEYSLDGGLTWNPTPANRNFDVSTHITNGTTIQIRRGTNGRSAPTAPQTITPLPRAQFADWNTTSYVDLRLTTNHRISTQQGPADDMTALMLRRFQIYDSGRWRNVPNFTVGGNHEIRLGHAAVRGRDPVTNARIMTGYAASLPMPLAVTWSTTLDNPNRPGNTMAGIERARIMPPVITP